MLVKQNDLEILTYGHLELRLLLLQNDKHKYAYYHIEIRHWFWLVNFDSYIVDSSLTRFGQIRGSSERFNYDMRMPWLGTRER